MTRYPPIALAYLASLLREAGHDVALMDAEGEELEIRSVALRMKPFDPDLIVGGVNIYNPVKNFEDLIYLKKELRAPLVIRGHYPRLFPAESIKHPDVDVVMTGKGYTSTVPLAEAIEKGGGLANIPGIYYRDGEKIKKTREEESLMDLDALPFPARDLFDKKLYLANLCTRRPFTTMFGSYGCVYDCWYCQEKHYPYRRRSTISLVAEMEQCANELGYREITFLDPTFTMNKAWVVDLCNRLIEKRLDLVFTIRTRADLLDEKTIRLLAGAGCVRISLGIESGDDGVLRSMNRSIGNEEVIKIVECIRRNGIMAFGFFMVGNKGETDESLTNTHNFIKSLPLHFAQFLKMMPLPYTEVLRQSQKRLGYNVWEKIGQGIYPTEEQFNLHSHDMEVRDLKNWIRRLFFSFYFSLSRIKSIFLLKYSPRYLWRQIDTAMLVIPLILLKYIRRKKPDFLLKIYPQAPNGGPGMKNASAG